MDVRINAAATASKVIEALRANQPMTESAHDSIPSLIEWLSALGLTALASDLAEAFAEYQYEGKVA